MREVRIINADDFGRDSQVNRAIGESFEKGYINQTTLMVNMPACDEAVEVARAKGFADKVGLHLNFTQGCPLTTEIRKIAACCNDEGCFVAKSFAMGLKRLDPQIARAVEVEARAQIEKYLSYQLPLLHCDGHHHVHNRIQIARIVLPLLKEYGFKTVRNRYSLLTLRSRASGLGLRKLIFNRMVARLGLRMTEGFGGWNVRTIEASRRFMSFEFMVHPNYNARGELVDVQDWEKGDGPNLSQLKELVMS